MLLQFVLHCAPGARTLRFVRKLPLLKGLSDNALIEVASRMTEDTYLVAAQTQFVHRAYCLNV